MPPRRTRARRSPWRPASVTRSRSSTTRRRAGQPQGCSGPTRARPYKSSRSRGCFGNTQAGVERMKTQTRAALIAMLAIGCWCESAASPQHDDNGNSRAITARVHGTFQDQAGGLGVLSGDLTVARFEVRNGIVTAIGEIVGALADSTGNVLGPVNQELALPVGNVASSCNQLRMDLAAADADVLQSLVHFDK